MTVEVPSNGSSEASSAPPARTTMQTLGWMLLYVVLLTPEMLLGVVGASTLMTGILVPRLFDLIDPDSTLGRSLVGFFYPVYKVCVGGTSTESFVILANLFTLWPLYRLRNLPNHPMPTLGRVGCHVGLWSFFIGGLCAFLIPVYSY